MSSISEKSGSYISGSDHHGHHVEHPHHHHHRHVHQPPHLMQTTEFDEDDEEDVDLRTSAAGTEAIIVGGHGGGQPGLGGLGHGGGHRGQPQPKQTTYLVDHHPQLFEPPSLTNYATMPRQPPGPQLTSTFSHPHHQANTMGRRPHGTTASAAASAASAHYNDEDIRRQAYIQSLGNPMDSVLQSSKAFVRDQRVFQGHVIEDPHMQPEDLDEDPTTVYYGGEVYSTNGLYVVNPPAPGTRGLDPAGIPSSAVHDNYGYLPSPPPVPPGPPHSTRYLYPENAGHLV